MGAKTKAASVVLGAALTMVIPLVERIEGVEYVPYRDIAGVWTVCAGITGPDVILSKRYTKAECDALLIKHIAIAQKYVDAKISVQVPASFRAAMYSFTFNAGRGAYGASTMLKLTNQGNLWAACEELHKWVYFTNAKTGKKEKSRGLVNRRGFEYEYCVKELK